MHRDPARRDEVDERVGDLLAEPFLDGEPARVQPNQPRQLRDAEDLRAGDVRDVCGAVERQRVMLAERVERDRPFDDLAARAVDARRALRGEGGPRASGLRRSRPSRRTSPGGTAAAFRGSPASRDPCRAPTGSRRCTARTAASRPARSRAARPPPSVSRARRRFSQSLLRLDGPTFAARARDGLRARPRGRAPRRRARRTRSDGRARRRSPNAASCVDIPRFASTATVPWSW